MNKVLIAGGSSFVGVNLTQRFKRLGYQVLVLEQPDADLWRLNDLMFNLDIALIDLADKTQVLDIVERFQPNIVISSLYYSDFEDKASTEKTYQVNFQNPVNLLDACKKVGVKIFLTIGSAEEYGSFEGQIDEFVMPCPHNDYGVAKVMFATYALKHSYTREMAVYLVRPFATFGAFSPHDKLIGQLFLSAYNNSSVNIRSVHHSRDFLYIDDLVDLILLICQKRPQAHYLFNAGSGYCYSIEAVIKKVVAIVGKELKINYASPSATDMSPTTRFADTTLATKLLGWTPKYTLEQGLLATKFWLDKNYQLYGSSHLISSCSAQFASTMF